MCVRFVGVTKIGALYSFGVSRNPKTFNLYWGDPLNLGDPPCIELAIPGFI